MSYQVHFMRFVESGSAIFLKVNKKDSLLFLVIAL